MTLVPATYDDLSKWHSDYLTTGVGEDALMVIVCFGGDRLSVIRDGGAFFAKDGDKIVGVVSYSPTGEYGTPNIVGLWVDRKHRRRQTGLDLARDLLVAAIEVLRPKLKEGEKIRVDVTTHEAVSVVSEKRLGREWLQYLDVHNGYF